MTGNIKVDNILIIDVLPTSGQNLNTTSLMISFATVSSQRMVFQTYGEMLIQNSSLTTYGTICLYHSIHLEDYSINIWKSNFITNFTDLFENGVSIAFFTLGQISILESNMETSILAMITQNNIAINYSNIDTTAKSCRTNMGAGRGLIVQIQNDFCSCGSAGAGYGLNSN